MDQIPLINLLHDLVKDPQLRQRFNIAPEVVLEDYGVKDDQRNAFFSMDPAKVGLKVGELIDQLNYDEKEWPLPSEDFFPSLAAPTYPKPTPKVFRTRPQSVSEADAQRDNNRFEFFVYGQSLIAVDLTFTVANRPPKTLTVDAQHRFGTFRGSGWRVVVSPPVGEPNFTVNDKITIVLKHLPNTPYELPINLPDLDIVN